MELLQSLGILSTLAIQPTHGDEVLRLLLAQELKHLLIRIGFLELGSRGVVVDLVGLRRGTHRIFERQYVLLETLREVPVDGVG
jgi:hypothetical protein